LSRTSSSPIFPKRAQIVMKLEAYKRREMEKDENLRIMMKILQKLEDSQKKEIRMKEYEILKEM